MAKSAKTIGVWSDIHNGAITAVCSEKPVLSELKTTYNPNKLQKELLQIWKDSIKEFQSTPDLAVINGEPVDGANPKQLGNQSWTTNMQDQAEDACKILKMIKAKQYMFVKGSGYHIQIQGTPIESFIAERMGGVKYSIYQGMQPHNADYWANVEVFGKKFSFTHHLPYAKFFAYRATPLAKEMALMALDKGRSMKYDVLVRSHVHYYMEVRSAHTKALTTPAWKYPDGHLTRGGLGGIFPDIGCVEIIIESNGKIEIIPHITELRIKPEVFKL